MLWYDKPVEKHMESGMDHYAKREEAAKKIRATVISVREKYGVDVDIQETPESVQLIIKNGEGNPTREFGVMKFEHIPFGDSTRPIEEVVEAQLRYPDLAMAEGIERIEEERRKE